ncbi:MAG: ATPase [Planctomycetaceae bacterium]|nr:ATPase [Planctomycetaceae bacterium]
MDSAPGGIQLTEYISVPPPEEPPENSETPEELDESSDEDDLSKDLEDLLDRVKKLEEANEELEDDLKKKFVVPGTSGATVKLGGRIHLDYWAFPGADAGAAAFEGENPQDRFTFRRIRPFVSGKITENMFYKLDMELGDPNDFEFRDVIIGFSDIPFFQTIQIGNQKRPYGLDHLNSSNSNIFLERPMVVEAFNEDARRLGIAAYGVSCDERWNWRYGIYNLERIQDDGTYIGDHYQLEITGRLANTYWWQCDGRNYAHWAISGAVAEPDGDGGPSHSNEGRFRTRPEARTSQRWLNTGRIAGADTYELLGLEKVVNVGPVQVVGELQNIWLQRSPGDDLHFWGGYAYVSYFLTGEHMPWDREDGILGRPEPFCPFFYDKHGCRYCKRGIGAWQVAVRYSHLDISDNDILGGIGDSVTCSVNWYWNANARLQFDYVRGWINDHAPVNGQSDAQYDIIGVRSVVLF